MSIDRICFYYSQLSVSFTSVVSKMVLKVLELWQMNVNNTKVYIISLKIISLRILCPNPSKDTNGSSVT